MTNEISYNWGAWAALWKFVFIACNLSNYGGDMFIQTKVIVRYKKTSDTPKIKTIKKIFKINI